MRWLKRLALAALIAEIAYIFAANALLEFGAIENVASSGKATRVGYRVAWSLWPGFVHVDDIRVLVQDRNIQFVLEIERADVRVRLTDLLHRTFHATRVRGEGVVFRFRQRIEPESASRPFVRALPHIPGFADPPLREPGPPPPPIDDAHYHLWTVQLEDVDVGVREIWMDVFRYQGQARAQGAFRLRPARRVWVGPAELTVTSGGITTGPHDVMRSVEGSIDCRVEDFDVQAVKGTEVFHYISALVRLAGHVPDLEHVNFLVGSSIGFSLDDGRGSVDADIAVDHGVFAPDTHFSFRTQHVGLTLAKTRLHLDGALAIVADGPSRGVPGRLMVSTSRSFVQLGEATSAPARLTNVEALATTTTADLTRRWSLGEGQLRIGEVALGDLRWLNDLPIRRPVSWSMEGGEGTLRGAFTLSRDRELGGWAAVRVVKGIARTGDLQVLATGDAQGTVIANPQHLVRGDVGVEAHDIQILRIGRGVCPLAHVGSASLTGRIARAEERPAVRELRATLRGSSFRWGAFEADVDRTSLAGQWNPGWMQARIDSSGLKLKNAGGPPRSWEARVASTSVDMVLAGSEGQAGGNVRVEVKSADGQVGKTKMRGDIIAQLAMTSPGALGTADLSGVVLAREVALSKGENRIDGWWAQVNLDHAALDTNGNLDVTAKAEARVQNGLPVLYLLSSEGESPNWLLSQLARHTLTVDLDVRRFCRWTDVQIPRIEGGLLFAQGRVQAEPGQTYGAMLFRLAPIKPISVGFSFYEDHSDASLLVGADWLEAQVLPMSKAATTRRETGCRAPPPTCE